MPIGLVEHYMNFEATNANCLQAWDNACHIALTYDA